MLPPVFYCKSSIAVFGLGKLVPTLGSIIFPPNPVSSSDWYSEISKSLSLYCFPPISFNDQIAITFSKFSFFSSLIKSNKYSFVSWLLECVKSCNPETLEWKLSDSINFLSLSRFILISSKYAVSKATCWRKNIEISSSSKPAGSLTTYSLIKSRIFSSLNSEFL